MIDVDDTQQGPQSPRRGESEKSVVFSVALGLRGWKNSEPDGTRREGHRENVLVQRAQVITSRQPKGSLGKKESS